MIGGMRLSRPDVVRPLRLAVAALFARLLLRALPPARCARRPPNWAKAGAGVAGGGGARAPPLAAGSDSGLPYIAKHIFQVFQMFNMYVTSVLYGCCKSRSRCCICCNGCTHILQASVLNVSSVVCCKCVYQDVAYIPHICFIHMLRSFYLDVV